LIFLVLLIPSAQFAWRNRTMPQFGHPHDDGILFETGKSLAHGELRIASLPENPLQTKYPPLYPLYLSLIWRLNPNFPDNLLLGTAMSWLVLVAFLSLSLAYYSSHALRGSPGDRNTWLLVALLAFSPYLILFGCTTFSEVFFTCLVLATFLAASRPGIKWAVAAGLLASFAYLSRTAGIALLVSVPLTLALKRDWRRASAFAAAMLPAVITWMLWSRGHLPHPMDNTLMYYTDYTGYEFLNVDLHNLPVVVWKNLDQLLESMGALALPKVFDILPIKILTQVIAVAMIAGIVRLARRGIMWDYAAFALVSSGILLIWHFPPNERFVLPLCPLLLAGLVTEIGHLGSMLKSALRHKDFGQRAVAGVMAAFVVIVFGAALITQFYVTFMFLRQSAGRDVAELRDQRAAYAWISANLPEDATVLSYDDPLLYLYTNRRGNYLTPPTRWWYADDDAALIGAYRNVAAYCRSRGLQYVYFTTEDLKREAADDDRHTIAEGIRTNPQLTPLYTYGIGTVYKVAR
jgi:hypothetical protein